MLSFWSDSAHSGAYNWVQENQLSIRQRSRVEAGSNTSIIALQVVGDEKGNRCLGDINTGTWPFKLGESRI
jgi:ribosomal protein S5